MAENVQMIFTINDFPTEIVERFAPDLRSRTVSTLRLVSPRFRDVFTSDRYYRSYLCYGKRMELYRKDLEEIGEARDRWRRCLEAEKRRMVNWRHGRPTRVETVRVPSDLLPPQSYFNSNYVWQVQVGEGNNNWMMCELRDQKVLLANVTGQPIITVVDVSAHTSLKCLFAHLLADQVVINGSDGSKQVFNILSDENKLALKHVFTIDAGIGDEVYISGISAMTRALKNFYIKYSFSQGDLRVWELKNSVANDNTVYGELIPPHRPAELLESYGFIIKKTDFPFLLVTIFDRKNIFESSYLAVNVEEKRVECTFPGRPGWYLHDWFVREWEIFIFFSRKATSEMDVRIYDLQSASQPGLAITRIFRLTWTDADLYELPLFYYEPPFLIKCSDCKTIIIRHVDEPELCSIINGSMEKEISAVVGPFLIVKSCIPTDEEDDHTVSAWDVAGKLLFDFAVMLDAEVGEVKVDFIPYSRDISPFFHTLSNCVVQNVKGDTLYICHF